MPKDDRFTCDNLKGTAAPGAETIVTFTFKPPEIDQLIVIALFYLGEDGHIGWDGAMERR
jgi:hypothetical protein